MQVPQSFRTSLRYYAWDAIPITCGYPFNRTSISFEGVKVGGFLGLRRFTIPWRDIEVVERTSYGVRFRFATEQMPMEIATPRHSALAEAISYACPDKLDPTITIVHWWRIG
jgi:hypothetical protein